MSMRQLARLDAKDALHQQFVVALHLLRRLPADGAGHVVPRKEKAEGNPYNRVGWHGEAAVLTSRRVVEAKGGSQDAGRE